MMLAPGFDFNAPNICGDVAFSISCWITEIGFRFKTIVAKPNESGKLAEMTNKMIARSVSVMPRNVAVSLESFLGEDKCCQLCFRV
jgi:hypothetical protein